MFQWFEKRLPPFGKTEDEDAAAAARPMPARLLPFIWASTEGARGWLLAMMVLTALTGVFEAWLYATLGTLVDRLQAAPPSGFWAAQRGELLLIAAVLVGSVVMIALQTLFKHQTLSGNFPMLLRWRFHRWLLDQSLGFFQDEFAGRISAKVMQTALSVRDICVIVGDVLTFIAITFTAMAVVVGGFDSALLLPFLLWVALYLAMVAFFVPRLGASAKAQASARSLMTGRITDAYTNIATVKLFSHAGREADYARSAMREFLATVNRQMRLVSGFEIVNHALMMLLILSTAGVAIHLWVGGQVGVGAVAAATAMALRLVGLSHWILWEAAALFEHLGTVQDGLNTIARGQAVRDAPSAVRLQVPRGEVRLEQVRFGYGAGQPVLDGLTLAIRPGEKIGLVGRSGAGKSTIVNLLLRFYDVEGGRILIDGQDIAGVTQESLRAQIGMVTQDTALLHRSVRENILYGRPDASDADMQRAARQAHADTFIAGLKDAQGRSGYDVHVGERGVKLSGGQRQRIAIARVMLKDAPILLLDEATSALDSEVEAAIQGSLDTLMQGKTVIAIAHRLSTIAAMDRLIVLDQGRIAEQGSHAELLAHGGIYARLWAHQSGGFLDQD
ncbi:MAG: ABC transporter ATP-binding protein [Comamonas sp.]